MRKLQIRYKYESTLRASEELFDLVNIFGEEEDKRASWFELKNAGAENEFVAINKFNKEYFNIPLLHLTEMYLTRAEANARLGNISVAVDDINMIIDRAYKTAAQQIDASVSQDALLGY